MQSVDYHKVLREKINIDSNGFPIWRETGKYCHVCKSGSGYPMIRWKEGEKWKSVYTARLIATAMIPNPGNLPYVHTIDGNPENTEVSNLEWSTSKKHVLNRFDAFVLAGLIREIVDCKTIDGARGILSSVLVMSTRKKCGRKY